MVVVVVVVVDLLHLKSTKHLQFNFDAKCYSFNSLVIHLRKNNVILAAKACLKHVHFISQFYMGHCKGC